MLYGQFEQSMTWAYLVTTVFLQESLTAHSLLGLTSISSVDLTFVYFTTWHLSLAGSC